MERKFLRLTALTIVGLLLLQTAALAVTHVETGESIHMDTDTTHSQLTDYDDYVLDAMQDGQEYRGIVIAEHDNVDVALPKLFSSLFDQIASGEVTESHLVGIEQLFDLPIAEEISKLPIEEAVPKIIEVLDDWDLFNKETGRFEPKSLTDPEPADSSRLATMRSGYGYTTVDGNKTPYFRFTIEMTYGETPRKDQSMHEWQENYSFVYDERTEGAESEWMLYSIVTYQLAFFQDRPEFIEEGINENQEFFTIRDDQQVQQVYTDPAKGPARQTEEDNKDQDQVVENENLELYKQKSDQVVNHYKDGQAAGRDVTLSSQDISSFTNLFYSLTLRRGIPLRSDEAGAIWQNGPLTTLVERGEKMVVRFFQVGDDDATDASTGDTASIELTQKEAEAVE